MPRYPRIRQSIAGVDASVASASGKVEKAAVWVSHLCNLAFSIMEQFEEEGLDVEIKGIELPGVLRNLLGLEEGETLRLNIKLAEPEEKEDEV